LLAIHDSLSAVAPRHGCFVSFTGAATLELVPVRRFAKGLCDDYEAVKAGVTLSWRMGPVDGHINRLNMLERQMFGRARLYLLSQRFFLAV
jgi:transposase